MTRKGQSRGKAAKALRAQVVVTGQGSPNKGAEPIEVVRARMRHIPTLDPRRVTGRNDRTRSGARRTAIREFA